MGWARISIETIFGLGLFVNAALFIPQAITLYREKGSKELSLITFLGFNVIQLFTTFHGILVKDYLLVIGYVLSFVTCGVVTLLIIYPKRLNFRLLNGLFSALRTLKISPIDRLLPRFLKYVERKIASFKIPKIQTLWVYFTKNQQRALAD